MRRLLEVAASLFRQHESYYLEPETVFETSSGLKEYH
jgi:hypothetical protein